MCPTQCSIGIFTCNGMSGSFTSATGPTRTAEPRRTHPLGGTREKLDSLTFMWYVVADHALDLHCCFCIYPADALTRFRLLCTTCVDHFSIFFCILDSLGQETQELWSVWCLERRILGLCRVESCPVGGKGRVHCGRVSPQIPRNWTRQGGGRSRYRNGTGAQGRKA